MKYDYEPLIDDFFEYNYSLALDAFKDESQGIGHRMFMDGIDFRFDEWEEYEHSKLKPLFEIDYNLLTENKNYFFGCGFDVYIKTYAERLNSFLIEFPDAGEIDFCEYELDKKVYYIMPELLELKIGFSIKKRNDFLNDKKAQLTTQLQQTETEPINESEPEQKTPYKIALLHELGFFKLEAIKKLTKENQYKIIKDLTGGTVRTIKGNVLVLDPNSNEDRIKYTSNNYTDEVKNYLDKLK